MDQAGLLVDFALPPTASLRTRLYKGTPAPGRAGLQYCAVKRPAASQLELEKGSAPWFTAD